MLPPLLLALCCSSAASSPPTGRWQAASDAGVLVGGAPSGHLGNPGHNVPLLGNGYLGLVLQSAPDGVGTHGYDFNGSTLELFLNTNTNWDCEKSAAADALPPAVCSMRGLGGLTIAVRNSSVAGRALSGLNNTAFLAEQRLANGSLWTERRGKGGAVLTSETLIHPERNLLLTTLSFGGPTPIELEVQLWALGRTSHVRPSAASSCALSTAGVGSCSRRYNAPNVTGFVAPWTALASRVVGKKASDHVLEEVCVNRFECVSTATSVYEIQPGETLQLISAAADNLLQGNAHDPGPDAAALAAAATPAAIARASGAFWRRFWNASGVSLPSRPALERMWYGAQFATVGSTASAGVVARMQGMLPPPGLYGPFATGDFAFWNGDVSTQCLLDVACAAAVSADPSPLLHTVHVRLQPGGERKIFDGMLS